MSGKQDFWEFFDDFIGPAKTVPATAEHDSPWGSADTSSAGTPTYVIGVDHGTSGGAPGVLAIDFDSQTEAQNVCISFDDVLQFDINDRLIFECRLKQNQATADAATSFAFGLIGDRNDAIDSIAQAMLFRYIGDNNIVCETDDGTTDLDDKATGQTLSNAYKLFKIDAQDLTDVKFYMGDSNGRLIRVAKSVTFDMSGYAGALQPFFQLQKTSDNNTDGVSIDYVRVTGRRVT